jgi:DNA-binding NtrC family response regulator
VRHGPWPSDAELTLGEAQVVAMAGGLDEEDRRGDERPPGAMVETLATVVRWHCEAVLGRCGGNRSEAARRLGISRATLRRRLGKAGA